MALQAGSTDTYEYQTTATDLASFGSYQWDMNASDGTLTGPYSAVGLFSYVSGPSVAITAPTAGQILTTSTPTFAWTAATQVTARVDIFNADTGEYVIGANINSASQKTWDVPAGYIKNNGSYTFQVVVTDASALTGSATQNFSLVYTVPAAVGGYGGSTIPLGNDDKPSTVLLSWDADTDPNFEYYTLKRRDAGTPSGDSSEIILRHLSDQNQVTFYDTNPVSGKSYIYSLTRTLSSGTDLLESDPAEVELMVEFDAIIISSVTNGLNYRVALTYQTAGKVDHRDDREIFMPWGETKPYIQLGSIDYEEVRASFRVITDRRGNARDIMENLRALKSRQISAADVLCYRDGRGRRYFGYISLSEGDDKLYQYVADVNFIETNFTEGEAA
jgi:hypothetical protein